MRDPLRDERDTRHQLEHDEPGREKSPVPAGGRENERAQDAAHYELVKQALDAILDPISSELRVPEELPLEYQRALQEIDLAHNANKTPRLDGYVSGLQRKAALNRALASLEPVFAGALESELHQDKESYRLLAERIEESRLAIAQRIVVEAEKNPKAAQITEDEERDDEPEDDDDPSSSDKPGFFSKLVGHTKSKGDGEP